MGKGGSMTKVEELLRENGLAYVPGENTSHVLTWRTRWVKWREARAAAKAARRRFAELMDAPTEQFEAVAR